jgi:hypothetical protein
MDDDVGDFFLDNSASISQPVEVHLFDPESGLPLTDPFPEYLTCPHCGEPEVETWCFQEQVRCHHCGEWFRHCPPQDCQKLPGCQKNL